MRHNKTTALKCQQLCQDESRCKLFNWNGQSQTCFLRSDLSNGTSSFKDVPASLVGAKDCNKIEIIWPEIFPASDSNQVQPSEPSATSTTITMLTTATTTTATESSTLTNTAEGGDLADSEPKTDRLVYSSILH
jgi:hypothetical protein